MAAAVDRISDLPESILHRILSSLSHKQAIQTSALSKQWRHVGPTGPKIDLRERRRFFKKSGRASFLSALGKTLQRYHHRNLPVHEFILQMSESPPDNHLFMYPESRSVLDKATRALLTNMSVQKFDFSVPRYALDPSLVFRAQFLTELYLSKCTFMTSVTTCTNDHYKGEPLFKGLKRLSLHQVSIAEENFVRILLSCRSIEYLRVSDCPGMTTIPEAIFQAESLTDLCLALCKLIGSSTQPLLIKRLKNLYLHQVYIANDALEEIVFSCPLIERVVLLDCVESPTIDANNDGNNNYPFNKIGMDICHLDKVIGMAICLNWYGHDKYFFPRLKTLHLWRVKLSAELFESFSSNFPSLEGLELKYCHGFSEIQLTVCSIKRLVIKLDSTERMVISIHAPNILCFELYVCALPELVVYTETGREWKSRVVMLSEDEVVLLPWLLQLSELLNSLRESQISLVVNSDPFKNLKVEDPNDAVFCNPVPLHRVCVKGDIPDFLDCLLLICRPRHIGCMTWYTTNSETGSEKVKNKQAEFIISEIMIRNQGEMSRGHLGGRDLEEISMQLWDQKSKGWHNVCVDGTSFPGFTSSDTKIRFPLKWRSGD